MKLLSLILAVLLMAPCAVYAEPLSIGEVVGKLPDLKPAVFYSLKDGGFNAGATVDLYKNGKFSLEGGWAGDSDESDHKVITAISYDLFKAKDYVSWPILKYAEFRPAFYVGLGSINLQDLAGAKLDFGFGASFLTLHF